MTETEIFDIIFLRHGESVGNAERRWQGQADYPLTDKGRTQSQALAKRWITENRNFDKILASPLKRAKETADIIASVFNLPVETDEIWMERNIGDIAGLTGEEVNQRFPVRNHNSPFVPLIGNKGEGNWELYLRAGRALHNLINSKPGNYLVVSHGGILNQIIHAVIGITPRVDVGGTRFRFKNTGFAHLTYRAHIDQWLINTLNDRSHWNGKDSV